MANSRKDTKYIYYPGGVVTRTGHSKNPKGSSSPVAASLGHSAGWCTTLPRTSPSGTNSAPEQICITFDRCKECTSGTRGRACSSCRHWPRGFARTQRSSVSSRKTHESAGRRKGRLKSWIGRDTRERERAPVRNVRGRSTKARYPRQLVQIVHE